MKNKKIKTLLTTGLVLGMLCSNTVLAAEKADADDNVVRIVTNENGEVMPYSLYFMSGTIVFSRYNGNATVTVNTSAVQKIDHIYHDVTIYKNGVWYSSDRYENWGKQSLNTTIYVPAETGDYIDVYVDHYTEHGGYTEVGHSSKAFTY